jgi:S1-C subfamily serine protease
MNQMKRDYDTFLNNLGGNITKLLGQSVEGAVNRTLDSVLLRDGYDDLPAQVYIRFGSTDNDATEGRKASYFPCEIVNVVKELDVAVLRIDAAKDGAVDGSRDSLPAVRALKYGQSSDLLVGQTLLAIGNPFGLDRTITSGIVSALGRSVTGVAGESLPGLYCVSFLPFFSSKT